MADLDIIESDTSAEKLGVVQHEGGLTRRGLLLGGAGGLALGVLGTIGVEALIGGDDRLSADQERLKGIVDEGLKTTWHNVVVFPGFLVASPGVRFYSNPTLNDLTEMPLDEGGGKRIGILRPFFVGQTLAANDTELGSASHPVVAADMVRSGTLGLVLPGDDRVVFFNYDDHPEAIETFSRLPGSESGSPRGWLASQNVEIVDRRMVDGGTRVLFDRPRTRTVVRYDPPIDPAHPDVAGTSSVVVEHDYRACAASIVYGQPSEAEEATTRFLYGNNQDPILPGPSR